MNDIKFQAVNEDEGASEKNEIIELLWKNRLALVNRKPKYIFRDAVVLVMIMHIFVVFPEINSLIKYGTNHFPQYGITFGMFFIAETLILLYLNQYYRGQKKKYIRTWIIGANSGFTMFFVVIILCCSYLILVQSEIVDISDLYSLLLVPIIGWIVIPIVFYLISNPILNWMLHIKEIGSSKVIWIFISLFAIFLGLAGYFSHFIRISTHDNNIVKLLSGVYLLIIFFDCLSALIFYIQNVLFVDARKKFLFDEENYL